MTEKLWSWGEGLAENVQLSGSENDQVYPLPEVLADFLLRMQTGNLPGASLHLPLRRLSTAYADWQSATTELSTTAISVSFYCVCRLETQQEHVFAITEDLFLLRMQTGNDHCIRIFVS